MANIDGFTHCLTLNPGIEATLFIAQAQSTDLFNNVQQAWNGFVQSGQIWALIIGFVVGYLFRSLTAY